MTYLRDPKLPSSNMYQKPDDIHNDWVREKLTEYWETYDRVHENLLDAAQKSKNYTDTKRGAKEKHFEVGMDVMLHWPMIKVGENKKFTSQWMPGWKIKEIVSDKNVIITHVDGKRQQLVHVDRLKQYFLPKYDLDSRCRTERKQNDRDTKDMKSAEEEKQIPKANNISKDDKFDISKAMTERSEKSKRVHLNQNCPTRQIHQDRKEMKKYPGLKEDVLKFTSSYFGNEERKNPRYNLRRVNRVNYNYEE